MPDTEAVSRERRGRAALISAAIAVFITIFVTGYCHYYWKVAGKELFTRVQGVLYLDYLANNVKHNVIQPI